jgi:uncharacterized protein YjbJ (UPF0337 family)
VLSSLLAPIGPGFLNLFGYRDVCPAPSGVRTYIANRLEEELVSRRRKTPGEKTPGEDKTEGAMDKAKGRLKEATGALSGDKVKKAEGRSDQRKGTLKEKKGHLKDLFK